MNLLQAKRSSGAEVVKLFAWGARGPGFATTISEIGYLLLQSRNMAEISIKWRKFSEQPTNQLQAQQNK